MSAALGYAGTASQLDQRGVEAAAINETDWSRRGSRAAAARKAASSRRS